MKIVKKTVIFLMVVCLFLQILPIGNLPANYVWAADDPINAVTIDESNFPDDNFRAYVKYEFDLDDDGTLNAEEQNKVTNIEINSMGIEDLSGIEYFINLENLSCSENQLADLDVSSNKDLELFACDGNRLTNLDVSSNKDLELFVCDGNRLTNLDVSSNKDLKGLSCAGNQLTSLDLSENRYLEYLYCDRNQLTSLNLSENRYLEYLYCDRNQLTSLNLSSNVYLEALSCAYNQLTSLDLSENRHLRRLSCSDNRLPYLDLSKNRRISMLDCSNNIYNINGGSINTSNIKGFDIDKASDWTNATVNGTVVSAIDLDQIITYTYKISETKSVTFRFKIITMFQVTFKDGNTAESTQTVKFGEAATAPVLNKTGYTLSWDKSFDNITEDTIVNAVWTPNSYSIHYNLDGGENNSSNPNEYTIENSTNTLKEPSRTGYTFNGWYTDSALTESVTEIASGSTGDKTFYVKWNADKYTINYQLNGGENNSGNPSGYDITSSKITLNTPTRTGYTFSGWYADSALTKKVTEIAAGSTGDKTFYAKWSANKYKVNFDKNGGSIKTSDKTKTYTYGSKYKSLPKAARKNYEFVGWYTKKSGGSKITSNSVVNITKTTTFYARWKKVTVGKAAIHKLTNPKANQIKVSIKKVSGADGYEVLYSVNSKFKSSKKTTVKSTSAALENLKKGRTYYVKIRAYKKDSTGKKVYGKYSKVIKQEVTK